MLKTDKERIVEELASELGSAETLIVADYRGLTNKQLEALRDQLIPLGGRFRIVKNTLTRRAAEKAGADALLVMLEGPTAIAFIESSGDPAAVAKALAATAKETNVLTLRGGLLEGKTLSGAEVDRLATLQKALADAKNLYWARQVAIQHKVASAFVERALGRNAEAVALMQEAADAEETSETHDTLSPGPIGMTAHEALGLLLLELGRPGEAFAAFEASLRGAKNRLTKSWPTSA